MQPLSLDSSDGAVLAARLYPSGGEGIKGAVLIGGDGIKGAVVIGGNGTKGAVVIGGNGIKGAVLIGGEGTKGAVLIGGAMGVRQDYYAPFAQWLAAQGYAVLTFDYRGMGESRSAAQARSLRGLDADLFAWARDYDTAIDALHAAAPGVPLYLIGHSLGAQLPGLLRNRDRIEGLLSVAAGSGYWRDNAPPLKRIVLYFWHVLVPVATAVCGYFPGKRIGKVGDLPRGVVLQWRRWCMNPRYLVGAEGDTVRVQFEQVRFPVVALSITDDELMTERGTHVLVDSYANAPRRVERVAPADVNVQRIGHFGFFREQFQSSLWARSLALLQGFQTTHGDHSMTIKTATMNGVATIEIARPEKKNAITGAMYQQMAAALDAAKVDPAVRAVIITGQPGIFTSGNDIEDFMQRPPGSTESPAFVFMKALLACDKPVIAAVTGAAIGIGTTMLLHCDFVYVSDEARLAMPFVSLGLVPEFASSLIVPQLMGNVRAAEKLLLGEPFTGADAVECGIANAVLPANEVVNHARRIAERFNALPPGAVRDSKTLMRRARAQSALETIGVEAELFGKRLRSPEAQEAFSAFFQKRKPDFSKF